MSILGSAFVRMYYRLQCFFLQPAKVHNNLKLDQQLHQISACTHLKSVILTMVSEIAFRSRIYPYFEQIAALGK
jgi:hypothetical protein